MDEDKLRDISEAEWGLLHSLRFRVTYQGYRDKILDYCQANQVALKRIDELLVSVEPYTIDGVFISGVKMHLFRGIDFKLAFEVVDRLLNELKVNDTNKQKAPTFASCLTDDGKMIFPYLVNKLINVDGQVKLFAEVHVVLVKYGYLKVDALPKTKGQPRGVVLVKMYKDAFGFLGDRSTFVSHIKSLQDMDPLNDNCKALVSEFKAELRRSIAAKSNLQS